MVSERKRTVVAVVSGVLAGAVVVLIGALILRGPVADDGWSMMIAGPWKFVLAATVVGSVIAGLITMVKVYRRLEPSETAE